MRKGCTQGIMRTMLSNNSPLRARELVPYLTGFIALYVFLDWVSFIEPLAGMHITPWNPDPALGLVLWLCIGKRAALPWMVALLLCEVVRGLPAGLPASLLMSVLLVAGYGSIGEVLRRRFSHATMIKDRYSLVTWLGIVVVGLSLTALMFVGTLDLAGLLPQGTLATAAIRFGIGDVVGVLMSMPVLWMVASDSGRHRLRMVMTNWETLAYVLLALLLARGVFLGLIGTREFKHFYFLLLPVIWAASRQGLAGTAVIVFVLQFGIIFTVRWGSPEGVPFDELQMLGAVIAIVGFFIGVLVDEQRAAAHDLKHSLRLAAAGEMAAALAHELNQPMTALTAYGKACDHLIARGDNGPLLLGTIHKMVHEAGRAAEVMRRLREFFTTGAMHFETASLRSIVETVSAQFATRCADDGVTLQRDIHPSLQIRADRLQIELVLRNLIANAFDAAAAGAAPRRVDVGAVRLPGGRLRITVEDSGSGVTRAVAARLFEPFVSGKSSGLGLGLVLSRTIVEAHGGTLWAEIGEHGIFRFILPLADPGVRDDT